MNTLEALVNLLRRVHLSGYNKVETDFYEEAEQFLQQYPIDTTNNFVGNIGEGGRVTQMRDHHGDFNF